MTRQSSISNFFNNIDYRVALTMTEAIIEVLIEKKNETIKTALFDSLINQGIDPPSFRFPPDAPQKKKRINVKNADPLNLC